jgi:hypothetical protein
MSIRPIDLDFGKYRKPNLKTFDFFFDFFFIIRLLVEKLIAWEGHDFESFRIVIRVELSELFIIQGSEASFSSYIDDEECFGSPGILLEVDDFAVDVFDFELKKVLNSLRIKGLFLGLEDDLSDDRAHVVNFNNLNLL